MAQLKFNNYTSTQSLKQFQISDLGGVDLTNSPLFVADNRASSMSNFIKENGVNQKRYGWRELYQFGAKINGVWEFDTSYINEDGEYALEHHIIVHSGTHFYKLSTLSNTATTITATLIQEVGTPIINNEKSYGVVGKEKLYILCGQMLTIGYYLVDGVKVMQVHKVEDDSDTYIPTTTIGITCQAHIVGDNDDHSTIRATYEDVNLMTRFRWNRLLGETTASITANSITAFEYYLDGKTTDTNSIEVYKLNADGTKTLLTLTTDYTIDNTETMTKITMVNNIVPIVEGQDNIYVKYAVYDKTNAQKINNCSFGILYGVSNIMDRLFVSGNSLYPNNDWHSCESMGGEQQDYTYFSDNAMAKLGNTTNAIKGYSILGDGTLAILKTASGQEPTIYFRTATMSAVKDSNGNNLYDINGNALTKETYYIQTGTIGEGLCNSFSMSNLVGDTLMLSNNGVYGIVLGDNIVSNQRYAKCRSRLINGELSHLDLTKATCIAFKEKYYMCLDNKCYIADGRYRYQLDDDLSDTFQYEWWVWDNIPARVMFSSNDMLYFGTDEGHICVFEKNSYRDITYSTLDGANGDIAYNSTSELFTINSNKLTSIEQLNEGDSIEILSNGSQVYAQFLSDNDVVGIADNKFRITNEDIAYSLISDMAYKKVYVDNRSNNASAFLVGTEYAIINVDSDMTFQLATITTVNSEETYSAVNTIVGEKLRICYKLTGENNIMDVCTSNGIRYDNCILDNGTWYALNEEGFKDYEISPKPIFNSFKILHSIGSLAEPQKIINYNSVSPTNIKCKFAYYQKVVSYYITKVFDFGTTIFSKKLNKLIITPDSTKGTNVDFGYETRTKEKTFNAYTGSAFNFDKINFDNLSFESEGFAKSYVKRARDTFNYIRFIFKNNTDDNCKISNLTVVYNIGKSNKGVN